MPVIDYVVPAQGVPLMAYIGLSVFMFCVGTLGVIVRRNPIVIFMCIELMLNSVNLAFVAFARYQPYFMGGADGQVQGAVAGQIMVLFVIAVAAAEVAVGLGIIMAIYRLRNSIDIDEMNLLRG